MKAIVGIEETLDSTTGEYHYSPVKVVAGIDPHQPFDRVMNTLRTLSPNGMDVHLVHAFDPAPLHNASERGRHAEMTLSGARTALEASGLGAAWIQRTADPAVALMDVAEAERADLIAVGAPRPGGGKVVKELLSRSPVSLLIVRSAPRRPEGLTAVLATDHSEYMKRCIDRLLGMNLGGVDEIVVLTANEIVAGAAAMIVHGLPDLAEKAEHWISEKLVEENRQVCDRLAPLGAKCRPEVREGYPNAVISQVMNDAKADLLIIGAPDHSPFDRVVFGSVSAEEVLRAPYSVLALRP